MNIPIFVINLDRSVERMKVIGDRLTELGLTYERFPAFDGYKLDKDFMEQNYPLLAPFGAGGGVGGLISHIEVCKLILRRGLERACIVEDDAQFDDEFPLFVDETTEYPSFAEVIKLEADMKRKYVMCSKVGRVAGRNLVYVPGNNTNGAACYIMTREGAAKFVQETSKTGYVGLDHFIFTHELSTIKSLHVLPYPARQGHVFVSTISEPLEVQISRVYEASKKKRRRKTMREVWQIRSRRSKHVFKSFLNSRHVIGLNMLRLTMARVQSKARPAEPKASLKVSPASA